MADTLSGARPGQPAEHRLPRPVRRPVALASEEGFEPTGCAGWTAVDLGFHLLSDARRALVALNTPADGPRRHRRRRLLDGVATAGARGDEELWSTRIAASVHGGLRGVAHRYAETSAAVVVAAGRVGRRTSDRTQGHALTVADFLSTLTVEAAVHHLDLVLRLDRPGPAAGPLAEVRRVLDGLLGAPATGGLGRRHRGPARHRAGAADRRRPRRARVRGGRAFPCSADRARADLGHSASCPPAAVPAATDVLVVGAGPAGSAAAAWAARAGHDVVLADAAVFPRDKTCGDGLTPRAIAELDLLGLGDWVRGHAPQPRAAGRRVRPGAGSCPGPAAALPDHGGAVPRTELDARIRRGRARRRRGAAGRRPGRRRRAGRRPGHRRRVRAADDERFRVALPPAGRRRRRALTAGPAARPGVAPRDRLRRGRPRLRPLRAQRRRVDLLAPRAARRARASCCPATAGSSRSARPAR